MSCIIDVKIRDLSATGALIRMASIVSLPSDFSLLIVSERKIYSAVARWRKGDIMGIEFVGKPRLSALRTARSHEPIDGTIGTSLISPKISEMMVI